jgi:2-dehydro-3-deoxyphosphogluconate aldolase/(4S)-4-hydroxy-2-oxoglutarate aldolase
MPRYTRLEVLNEILRIGLIPLFFEPDTELAFQATQACLQGGARLVEFTNRGDFAWQVFSEVQRRLVKEAPDVILGAGTIDDAPTAAMFIASGANFIVGPTFNEEVARLCNRRKVAYIPGCATVNEIANAEEWGAEICKIFPGETVGGPQFVKAVLAPRPWSRLMPTGGVSPTEESLKSWFQAGVCAVGMGSSLISKDWVKAGQFAEISRAISQSLAWIQAARSG